jgi:ubiquinol-cytochrome c reductase iron-sulfur subunit
MKNLSMLVAALAALGAAVTAALHVDPGIVGLLVALAFAAVALWAGGVALAVAPADPASEPRHRPAATPSAGVAPVTRAGVFGKLWGYAAAAFALAGLVPLVSLGRRVPRGAATGWTRGARLITADGTPVRPDDIAVGGVTTVFPEGRPMSGDAATLLIRVEPGAMLTDNALAPHGNVAFSKICTHAGCPVAIYRHADYLLYCPCHQSEFAVLFGAKPVSGPATRALPQLGLDVGPDGYLIARGDFSGPVGPDDWNRPV